MIKNGTTNRKKGSSSLFWAVKMAVIFFISGKAVSAQTATCGVGTRVFFEDGTRGVGTILEIGTESPHVGWYFQLQLKTIENGGR